MREGGRGREGEKEEERTEGGREGRGTEGAKTDSNMQVHTVTHQLSFHGYHFSTTYRHMSHMQVQNQGRQTDWLTHPLCIDPLVMVV